MTKIYINDTGSSIILETGLVLTGALSLKIAVRKPDMTEIEWPAIIHGDTAVKYITVDGDLNMPGIWTLHSNVEMSDGEWLGESVSFEVFRKFN